MYHPGDEVPVVIDGQEVGRIAAGEILVEFHNYGDGKPVWRSSAMTAGQPAKAVDVARNACATYGVRRTSMGTTRSSPPKSPAAAA